MQKTTQRYKVTIEGIVQGIGFRPYIFNLARENNLGGFIRNNGQGVHLEIEGESTDITSFITRIRNNPLPLAQITAISKIELPTLNESVFKIVASDISSERNTLIAPDICVCDDCLREMLDPNNRRYRYPFINCTNCGPRYTIIEDIPYDRPKTAMKNFRMCAACESEYHNPQNRRFHAQPNACPECGPQITLYDKTQKQITTSDPIQETIDLLQQGYIIAIKGLGGFHLVVDATNQEAVQKLRVRKNREEKPLAMMSLNLHRIKEFAIINPEEEPLLLSPQRPIVLLEKRNPNPIAPEAAPGNRRFGVMLPYTPLHYLLCDSPIPALVMTSGNMSEEPITVNNNEGFKRLAAIADFFLIHNRDIYLRSDDSVSRIFNTTPLVLRRSRGYVPQPIILKQSGPSILACGAELKNTICLTKNKNAFVSQHIGDLKNIETYDFFIQTINHLKQILDIRPEFIAYDLHPDYLSSRYALKQTNFEKIGVQHHHAHIASCMLENSVEGPVIGLALDGTGYGTDGRIWGGEVLLVDGATFQRLAHPEYVRMPGGESAIKQPWRMAISYLFHSFGYESENVLPLLEIPKSKTDTILKMIESEFNSPETSGIGRLFDGVSGLLNICHNASYEGQAAIELEMRSNMNQKARPYPFEWRGKTYPYQIQIAPIIKGIISDIKEGRGVGEIGFRFHLTLIILFSELCLFLKKETGLNRVALSGGVFQNMILLKGLYKSLTQSGFQVFTHSKLPPNDGGISLGQISIAKSKIQA